MLPFGACSETTFFTSYSVGFLIRYQPSGFLSVVYLVLFRDSAVVPPASFHTDVQLFAAGDRVCVVGLTPAAPPFGCTLIIWLVRTNWGCDAKSSVDAIFGCAIKSQSILFQINPAVHCFPKIHVNDGGKRKGKVGLDLEIRSWSVGSG